MPSIPTNALDRYRKVQRRLVDAASSDAEKATCREIMAKARQAHPGIAEAAAALDAAEAGDHEQKAKVHEKRAKSRANPEAAKRRFREQVRAAVKPDPRAGVARGIFEQVLGWAAEKAAERVEAAFKDQPEILDEFADQFINAQGDNMAKKRGSNKKNPVQSIDEILNAWEAEDGIVVEVTVDDADPEEPVVEDVSITLSMNGELLASIKDQPLAFGEYVLECIDEAIEDALGGDDDEDDGTTNDDEDE